MSEQVEVPEVFRISVVIPEGRFIASVAPAIRKQVRAVMKEAMRQTGQSVQVASLGLRIHVQHKMPDDWDASTVASARQGRITPQVSTMDIGRICGAALRGILYRSEEQVLQLLVTTGWGETDAMQLSSWEIDLGRREGVQ